MNKKVIIVGAGLSGLYAASILTAQEIECKVLEAGSPSWWQNIDSH